jgi:hypothetical protein
VVWWNAFLNGSRVPLLFTEGSTSQTYVVPLLVLLFLAFPEGRLGTTWRRVVFGFSVATSFLVSTAFAPFYDPRASALRTASRI